jgi:hypothetical protein
VGPTDLLVQSTHITLDSSYQLPTYWPATHLQYIHPTIHLTQPTINQCNQSNRQSVSQCVCLYIYIYIYMYVYIYIYIGCPRRNEPDYGRMFLMLNYTDITQNTYIQSWTVTEIMAREKCGLLAVPLPVSVKLTHYPYTAHVRPWEQNAVNVVTAM